MKSLLLLASFVIGASASAQTKFVFSGSDTLAGAMTDAIIAAGMEEQIQYAGGGSGVGEKNLVSGDQGIAPMSREIKPEITDQLSAKGLTATPHVLALDGLSLYVKADSVVQSVDLVSALRIFTCEYTRWEQVPGSGLTGEIKAYRRNDSSGTTDAFKHFTGIKAFGACVVVLNETADISDVTSREPLAIGYSGLSGKVAGNRALGVARKQGEAAILPTTATIRNFSYPMARKLYVYEIGGSAAPNEAEANLLLNITDRSFMDPIMQAHEFITID